MRILKPALFAALSLASLAAPAVASAHDFGDRGDWHRDRGWHDERGWRDWHDGYRYGGPRCWVEWHHGYRVHVCR